MKKIKVLIAILGIDQHEVGAITIARCLRDAGMEVVYAGRFQLPPTVVKTAIEEDVDLIGLSCHSGEYLYLLPEVIERLKEEGYATPVIAGGSIITARDEQKLLAMGVRAAFGPHSTPDDVVRSIQNIVNGRA